MEEVGSRLDKIEKNVNVHQPTSRTGSFKRSSSVSKRVISRSMSNPQSPIAGEVSSLLLDHETSPLDDLVEVDFESDSENDTKVENVITRNDLVNPFWIEDKDLKNGKQSSLNDHEIKFWEELIGKYLQPLIKDEAKEKKQQEELITLRNQMVFSFFMLNAIFVLVVFLLQSKKEMVFIEWPIPKGYNITFTELVGPTVAVKEDILQLEPIGTLLCAQKRPHYVCFFVHYIGKFYYISKANYFSSFFSRFNFHFLFCCCHSYPNLWNACSQVN